MNVLEAHFNMERSAIQFRADGFTDGVTQGFWSESGTLTEKGEKFFDSAGQEWFWAKKFDPYVVEITGLTDKGEGEPVKWADFTLSNERLTEPARRFAVAFGTGRAEFRRYDDGWRLETPTELNVEFDPTTRLELSAADEAAIKVDTAARAARVMEANKVTEEQTFACNHGNKATDLATLTVTNSGIHFTNSADGSDREIGFGDMKGWESTGWFLNVLDRQETKSSVYFNNRCPDYNEAVRLLERQFDAWRVRYPDLAL